jgi:cob(I)alamin adenosyltransferase
MAFEDYKTKESVVLVYTGDGKGKTSASVGLMARALGNGWRVAFIQFIKHWEVSEHKFIQEIQPLYGEKLYFYKGGMGFYNAGDMSAKNVTPQEHQIAAKTTYDVALKSVSSGKFDLVICDEINNAVNDKLLSISQVAKLIDQRNPHTSLCLTGRNFNMELIGKVDIATEMNKIKHHFDDKYLANKGIDF